MTDWIPTNELRFVDRGLYEDIEIVLQQKWQKPYKHEECEWRDVPVVEEE